MASLDLTDQVRKKNLSALRDLLPDQNHKMASNIKLAHGHDSDQIPTGSRNSQKASGITSYQMPKNFNDHNITGVIFPALKGASPLPFVCFQQKKPNTKIIIIKKQNIIYILLVLLQRSIC